MTATSPVTRQASNGASPPARRSGSSPWRDPRLVVGVALVAVSVLAGARLLAASDDTVAVWALRTSVPSGAPLDERDLVVSRVRFADEDAADRYVSATSVIAPGSTVVRDLTAGELLPRSALAGDEAPDLVELPLSVPSEHVPATVSVGSVVDVWVTTKGPALDAEPESMLVLDDVVVVAAPRSESALGPSATRQVIVGVPSGADGMVSDALAAMSAGPVVLTRQG